MRCARLRQIPDCNRLADVGRAGNPCYGVGRARMLYSLVCGALSGARAADFASAAAIAEISGLMK